MDLKVNSGPPPSPHKLSHCAPPPLPPPPPSPPPRSLASSIPACLQAPSPAQALGALSLNLASDAPVLPRMRTWPPTPSAPPPAPAQRAGSRARGLHSGALGPGLAAGRAGGPRRARLGPTDTPRASPQPLPGPSAPANAQPRRIVFKESWGSLWHITNCDRFCVNIFSCICGLCIYIYV